MTIAAEHLRSATVQLVIVGGGPGTGKTTLAHALAEQINAQVLSTDDVRRTLQQSGGVAGAVGDFDAGLYSPENVAKVYDEVLRRADTLLSAGSSVILDGTWRDVRQRERAHRLGVATSSPVVDFTLSLPVAVAAGRVIARGPIVVRCNRANRHCHGPIRSMGPFARDRLHASAARVDRGSRANLLSRHLAS